MLLWHWQEKFVCFNQNQDNAELPSRVRVFYAINCQCHTLQWGEFIAREHTEVSRARRCYSTTRWARVGSEVKAVTAPPRDL